MPLDVDGNYADFCTDPDANISRTNMGSMYEGYLQAASRKAKSIITMSVKALRPHIENIDTALHGLSHDEVDNVFKTVLEFTHTFRGRQDDAYKKLLPKESEQNNIYNNNYQSNHNVKIAIIKDIIVNEFYIFYNYEDKRKAWKIATAIRNTKFRPTKERLSIKGELTEEKIPLQVLHTVLLNKIADTPLSVASTYTNHHGLSTASSNKHQNPWNRNATKTGGETEYRLFVGFGGRKLAARLALSATDLAYHKHIYDRILRADNSVGIEDVTDGFDTTKFDPKILEMVNSIMKINGFEISQGAIR